MTDHAKEAQKILEHTLSYDVTDDNTTALVNIGAAQIHATLALVEQQRIANLIALAESPRTTVNGARAALSGLYTGSAEEGTARMGLLPEIKEALGL